MDIVLTYRGRDVTEADVASIRELIAAHPAESRRGLSKLLCAQWNWVQANGAPRDMVCRSLMLALDRAGHIQLPPQRRRPPNPIALRAKPKPVEVDQTPMEGALGELGPLEVRQVRRTGDEPLFNSLMQAHHYLGYTQPVGEHLKHLVLAGGRPVACFAFSSGPRHLGPSDRYIGWSKEARRCNLRLLAYNTRFLVLPWVRVPHLASHLLGRIVRQLPSDWMRVYGHEVCFALTFVDTTRFKGTCYRAANWRHLGRTVGRGNNAPTHEQTRPIKDVLGMPLCRDWRERMTALA